MDFREANKLLYKRYLYQLIFAIVLVIALIIGIIAVVIAVAEPVTAARPSAGSTASLWPVVESTAAFIVVALAVYLFIWFRYIFRGYVALHRLGVAWAFWLAWGPIIEVVLAVALVGTLLIALPSLAAHLGEVPVQAQNERLILETLMSFAPFLVLLAASMAFGIFLDIAHILFLDKMKDLTKLSKFNAAFVLYIVAFVLSLASFVSSIVGTISGVVALVEYIIEMLAYRGASAAPLPTSLGQPSTPGA
jgi:magnesium-transporting ATPase (P-type)